MARADRETCARVIADLQPLASVLVIDCATDLAQAGVQAAVLSADQLVLVTEASGTTASLAAEAAAGSSRRPTSAAARCRRHPGVADHRRLGAAWRA